MKTFSGLEEFAGALDTHLGYSEWRTITQNQVDLFAEATDDHQWIHTDTDRAHSGPFGGPIAHGYLTLSLIPALMREIYQIEGLAMGVNYGSNKVRFPGLVPVGSRVRAGAELISFEQSARGAQATVRVTIEVDGSERPGCVADVITLLHGRKEE
ncbi:MaoC family dehydratase [Nesterenkonia populi]|uniref:MaoC family dehydratase n=1 Tax=Nesterenkonia populi TaxID=1591087 RepID=UPI0011BDF288|nr:MaoC family dehydratase [Nesterenkonia populi]